MFVVMAAGASEAEVLGVKSRILAEGLTPFDHVGADRTSSPSSARSAARKPRCSSGSRRCPGVEPRHADQPAVQADVARVPPRGHGHPGPRRGDRRRLADGHGRPLLGREPRPAVRDGRRASRRPARRSCAAARSSRGPARTPSRVWASRRLRYLAEARERTGLPVITEVMEPVAGRHRRRVRRHPPDRHPEHAELLAAARRRAGRPAGDAQARLRRDDRGVADGRRVHRQLRQPERDPVRARDPHVRDVHPQHDGPGRGAARSTT